MEPEVAAVPVVVLLPTGADRVYWRPAITPPLPPPATSYAAVGAGRPRVHWKVAGADTATGPMAAPNAVYVPNAMTGVPTVVVVQTDVSVAVTLKVELAVPAA